MKNLIFLLAWFISNQAGGGLYACKNAKVSLFSKAPLEDIEAVTSSVTSVYNSATGEVAFNVPIRSFRFKKSLMQEHFNENYLESDKYPNATFRGKVQSPPDVSKDGVYPVKATGDLTVHGVTQNRTIDGTFYVKNGTVSLNSDFTVKCVDHKIDIPKLVFKNIAESITIKVTATYVANK